MMGEDDANDLKCFEYVCPLFPRCEHAAGGCGVDDFFDDVTLNRERCFDIADKPLFKEKRKTGFR